MYGYGHRDANKTPAKNAEVSEEEEEKEEEEEEEEEEEQER